MGLEIDEKQAKLAETGQIRENLSLKGPFRKNVIIDFVVLSINATWASDICIVVFNTYFVAGVGQWHRRRI